MPSKKATFVGNFITALLYCAIERNDLSILNGLNVLNSSVLPRWNWSWAGELFIKLYALRIPRQVSNRLFVCFRCKRTWIVTNQFMVFLEERRILKTLTQGFFDDFHSILGHGRRENEWRAGQTEIAEHGHYLAFPLGFCEAVNFRQIGKLRVFIFSWHSEDDM